MWPLFCSFINEQHQHLQFAAISGRPVIYFTFNAQFYDAPLNNGFSLLYSIEKQQCPLTQSIAYIIQIKYPKCLMF